MSEDTWIGLMSGTSMDSIDAVLVSFGPGRVKMLDQQTLHYPVDVRQRLCSLSQNQATPDELGELDCITGELFAEAAMQLVERAGDSRRTIRAIGSHGQTIRHQPTGPHPFSIQLGDPSRITELTGITTVADFRRRDMAAGGEGAPLAPAFHRAFFGSASEDRCILNLGGIANISWLPAGDASPVMGFDTGPANALMDAWCHSHTGRPYDENGVLAREGSVDVGLLDDMLSDAYFLREPPKSTGKEKFNLEWITTVLKRHPDVSAQDVQRTLLALTAESIARQLPESHSLTIYACGGGTQNPLLMQELAKACVPHRVCTTSELGLDPQWVEPAAFAWLARQTLDGLPGNTPSVTGAAGPRILGAIYQP
jgi:anhydro-N-acetylmuramic acid kinase